MIVVAHSKRGTHIDYSKHVLKFQQKNIYVDCSKHVLNFTGLRAKNVWLGLPFWKKEEHVNSSLRRLTYTGRNRLRLVGSRFQLSLVSHLFRIILKAFPPESHFATLTRKTETRFAEFMQVRWAMGCDGAFARHLCWWILAAPSYAPLFQLRRKCIFGENEQTHLTGGTLSR